MIKNKNDQPLVVEVKNGRLSISIGINVLAFASSWENGGPVENFKVGKGGEQRWAESIAYQINRDTIDDPIPISEFLDNMIERAHKHEEEYE